MPIEIRGVENRLEVPALIASESLYRIKDHLIFPLIANRNYEEYFEQRIGNNVTIKRPYQAKVVRGRKADPAAMIDKSITFSVSDDDRYNFSLQYDDVNRKLDITEFGSRYLAAGAEELAYQYDIDGANEIGRTGFYMNPVNGTPSQIDFDGCQAVRAHAKKVALPRRARSFMIADPLDIAAFANEIRSTANDHQVFNESMMNDSIRDSFSGRVAGFNVMESVHLPYYETLTYKAADTPQVDGAWTSGNHTQVHDGEYGPHTILQTKGWENAAKQVLKKGNLISISSCKEIQPRGDRRETGNVMHFVVLEDVMCNASGQADVKIYPQINAGSSTLDTIPNPNGKQLSGDSTKANLDASAFQTVSAHPGNNDVIKVVGSTVGTAADTGEKRRQSIFVISDALEYVNITMPNPDSAYESAYETDPDTGLSISYVADFNWTYRTEQRRIDAFFKAKNVYPEMQIRWIGATV